MHSLRAYGLPPCLHAGNMMSRDEAIAKYMREQRGGDDDDDEGASPGTFFIPQSAWKPC